MTLAFDTHTLLWWIDGDRDQRLSSDQLAALRRAGERGDPVGVPAICFWEIAKLVERGRLEFDVPLDDVFDEIEEHPTIRVLELTPRIALESTRLGASFHNDPADQLIVATARVHGLKLVTADDRIRGSRVLGVV